MYCGLGISRPRAAAAAYATGLYGRLYGIRLYFAVFRCMTLHTCITHRPMSQTAPVLALSRLLSDNSRLIVSDVIEVPVDLRSLFSKSVSPAMYKAELRRHVEHVRWYLEHPTEARGLSQSRTTSSARSGHASSTTTCSNSGILHQRSG